MEPFSIQKLTDKTRWVINPEEEAKMRLFSMARLTAILIFAAVLTGCYSFIGRYGSPFYEGPDTHYFERLVDRSFRPESLGPDFTPKLAPDEALQVEGAGPELLSQCLNAPVLLRFAWLSDVQLRQREVKLFNDRASLTLDKVIPSFERNPVQEDYHWAVYTSYIAAINQLHRNGQPLDFMIHTGDAIDAGSIEELYKFIYITNKLQIPWLNLIGNHDISIFGNYRERLGYTREAGVSFYPVGNQSNFLLMHARERMISGFGPHLLPVPAEMGHSPSMDGNAKISSTCLHGFDLYLNRDSMDICPEGPELLNLPGYYAFDIDAAAVPIRVIALNSARQETWGADGEIDASQRAWLQQLMDTAEGRLLLVFSHHRPFDFDAATLSILHQQRVEPMVFFSGHTHKHHLTQHNRGDGRAFFELNTGSILDYPQLGRLIELRGAPGGELCLISRTLWPSHLNIDRNIPGEELQNILTDCEGMRLEYFPLLYLAASCGHYGALEDFRGSRASPFGKLQSMEAASSAANVVILLKGRGKK
jgi:hypothetical protein